MRRLAATFAALVVLATCAGAAAAGRGAPPAFPNWPGNWAHVEFNEKISRVPHTIILDRGLITQVSAAQLTLRELGQPVVIPLSADTIIMFKGSQITAADLRKGRYAETMRIDGGAAVRVRETLRP